MLKIGDFSKLSRVSIRMLRHLRCKQAELQALSEETAYRLRLLETAQTRLRKEDKTMKYDVTIKIFPARYSATVRMVIPSYEQMGGINEAVAA